jgi:hypothetical protein
MSFLALVPNTGSALGGAAYGINSSGEIVGTSAQFQDVQAGDAAGYGPTQPEAALWESPTSQPLQLDQLLGSATGSVTLTQALQINCQGDITASGYAAGGSASDVHSYLLIVAQPNSGCPQ